MERKRKFVSLEQRSAYTYAQSIRYLTKFTTHYVDAFRSTKELRDLWHNIGERLQIVAAGAGVLQSITQETHQEFAPFSGKILAGTKKSYWRLDGENMQFKAAVAVCNNNEILTRAVAKGEQVLEYQFCIPTSPDTSPSIFVSDNKSVNRFSLHSIEHLPVFHKTTIWLRYTTQILLTNPSLKPLARLDESIS